MSNWNIKSFIISFLSIAFFLLALPSFAQSIGHKASTTEHSGARKDSHILTKHQPGLGDTVNIQQILLGGNEQKEALPNTSRAANQTFVSHSLIPPSTKINSSITPASSSPTFGDASNEYAICIVGNDGVPPPTTYFNDPCARCFKGPISNFTEESFPLPYGIGIRNNVGFTNGTPGASPSAASYTTQPQYYSLLPMSYAVFTSVYRCSDQLGTCDVLSCVQGAASSPISQPIAAQKPYNSACHCGDPLYPVNTQVGDPIDTASGIFFEAQTDMAVSGGRIPFGFTRSYRTLDNNLGPFGVGTSSNFDMFVQRKSANTLELKMQDNARFTYTLNAQGTAYVNTSEPVLFGSTLVQNIPDTTNTTDILTVAYTLQMRDGTSVSFDSAGFEISTTDRNGNLIRIVRDLGNGIGQITSPSGTLNFFTTRISNGVQTAARIDSITDRAGRSVFYTYNSNNQLITVTYPDGSTINYVYDPTTGAMTSGIDARNITFFQNYYDSNGRVYQQVQPEGRIYQFNYTLNGTAVTKTKVTLPNGNILTFDFNGNQYPLNFTDPMGKLYQVNRDPSSNLIGNITDPLSHQYSMGYDALGNLKTITNPQITDPTQQTATINYEPTFNLPISATDYLGKTSTITRDANGNPTRMQDPLGHGTTISYTSVTGQTCTGGQVCSIQNDVDGLVSFNYDTLGRLIQKTAPLSRVTQYFYDEDGVRANRLTSVKDPLNRITRFTYDALDRVTEVTYPDNSFIKMVYDPNGNLKEFYDENQGKTTYDYDNMNRLTKRTNPLGQFDQYTYDFNNNLKTHIDRKGRTFTYFYDVRDDLKEADLPDQSVISYSYDDAGKLKSIADSVNGTITWDYDALDRVFKETTSQGVVQYSYDNINRRTSLTAPNGYSVSYFYDEADRLKKITRSGLDYLLDYDNADRLNSVVMPNGVAGSIKFDTAGRLQQILYKKGTTTLKDLGYVFDTADQLKQITGLAAAPPIDKTVTSTSLNANNQYLSVGSDTLQHDSNGNLSTNAQTTYQWDVRDRLIGLTGSGVTASFSYDALGRRKSKTVNGTTTTFLYDGSDILQDSTASYLHGPGVDNIFSRTVASSNEYFLTDHLGSTIALTDGTGNISTQYAYSAYGKATKTGSSTNYFTYTGREDDGTGLYFYRARYYSPDLKRFVAEDPIGFAGGQSNLYGYVGGNPISNTDPSGLRTYILPGAGGGAGGQGFGGGNIKSNIEMMGGPNNSKAENDVKVVDLGFGPNGYLPGLAGATSLGNISRDLLVHPLDPGESINVIAYSNGNNALKEVVDGLNKSSFIDGHPLNVIIIDPWTAIWKIPAPGNCNIFTILSNAPNSSDAVDKGNAGYALPEGNSLRLPDGTTHRAIPDKNGWIQWLRSLGVKF